MWQIQTHKSSLRESIRALEDDVQHANKLVAALPQDSAGDCVRMKLSYSPLAPFLLFLIEWMDWSCSGALLNCLGILHILVYRVYVDGMPTATPQERKASLREFYAIIYPLLKQLDGNVLELMEDNLKRTQQSEILTGKGKEDDLKPHIASEDEEECGICMEMDSQVALPNCGHSMCISCFHNWYVRSQSCPFCRGSLKRVSSGDLWVLTSNSDVVDAITLAKDNLRRFYLYIEKLPLVVPENHLLMYDYLL